MWLWYTYKCCSIWLTAFLLYILNTTGKPRLKKVIIHLRVVVITEINVYKPKHAWPVLYICGTATQGCVNFKFYPSVNVIKGCPPHETDPVFATVSGKRKRLPQGQTTFRLTHLFGPAEHTRGLNQGCTNAGLQVVVADNICWSWVRNLLHVILLAPRILREFQDFFWENLCIAALNRSTIAVQFDLLWII